MRCISFGFLSLVSTFPFCHEVYAAVESFISPTTAVSIFYEYYLDLNWCNIFLKEGLQIFFNICLIACLNVIVNTCFTCYNIYMFVAVLSVAHGDINGDGLSDLIVGIGPDGSTSSEQDYVYGNGYAIVVFGTKNTTSSIPRDASELNGRNGFIIHEPNYNEVYEYSFFGYSVGSADFNCDGFDDIIIGAFKTDVTYVVYGGANISDSAISNEGSVYLSTYLTKDTGIGIYGIYNGWGASSGYSVSGIGDMNGDGCEDIAIASNNDATYVLFGGTGKSDISLSGLSGQYGFIIDSTASVVSGAGDVNGDGYDDIIVGSESFNGYKGKATVVLGSASVGSIGLFDDETITQYLDGCSWYGDVDTDDYSGVSNVGVDVSGAGDVNGDGYDDVLISAEQGAYLIFGSSDVCSGGYATSSSNQLSSLSKSRGIQIGIYEGYLQTTAYSHISSAGDINSDGFGDFIFSCQNSNTADEASIYVVFGSEDIGGSTGIVDVSTLDGCIGIIITITMDKLTDDDFGFEYYLNNVDGVGDFYSTYGATQTSVGILIGGGFSFSLLNPQQTSPSLNCTYNSTRDDSVGGNGGGIDVSTNVIIFGAIGGFLILGSLTYLSFKSQRRRQSKSLSLSSGVDMAHSPNSLQQQSIYPSPSSEVMQHRNPMNGGIKSDRDLVIVRETNDC